MIQSRSMKLLLFLASFSLANAYWLMGMEDFIATERMDPIVSPGKVASHVHSSLFFYQSFKYVLIL